MKHRNHVPKLFICICLLGLFNLSSFAEDEHSHDHTSKSESEKDAHSHDESDGHAHNHEHAHEEKKSGEKVPAPDSHEEHADHDHGHKDKDEGGNSHGHGHDEGSSKVGPGKAVSQKGPLGFQLSPEATKTLDLKLENYNPGGSSSMCLALVQVRGEKFAFRLRNQWFQKVKIQSPPKADGKCVIQSTSLTAGDQVVVRGAGLLRLTEIFLTEEATHSH